MGKLNPNIAPIRQGIWKNPNKAKNTFEFLSPVDDESFLFSLSESDKYSFQCWEHGRIVWKVKREMNHLDEQRIKLGQKTEGKWLFERVAKREPCLLLGCIVTPIDDIYWAETREYSDDQVRQISLHMLSCWRNRGIGRKLVLKKNPAEINGVYIVGGKKLYTYCQEWPKGQEDKVCLANSLGYYMGKQDYDNKLNWNDDEDVVHEREYLRGFAKGFRDGFRRDRG